MAGNMQKQAENPKETYEEPEAFSGEIVGISDIFASELGEEISWYSDTTGYYMIPCMDGEEALTVLFSSENSISPNSIVFYVEIITARENDHGGLVCSGSIFRNDGGLTNDNNTVEITWDSWETMDCPTVRMTGNSKQADTFMVAGDYYYFGEVENTYTDNDSEYIFSDSSSRLLTEADISGRSAEELRIAKNEIYARHGRIFTSEDLKEYFESKSWYQGYIPADQFKESVFNQVEKDNIVFIQSYIDNPLNASN